MATAGVQIQPNLPMPVPGTYKPIIEPPCLDHNDAPMVFDPKEHLTYQPPESVVMMKDIGFGEDVGISPVAVSQPFPLFGAAAVQKLRDEALNETVLSEHSVVSNIAACQIRGYVPKHAPFTYDAWTNPETLRIVSEIAGVELIPWGNYEIAHINVSVKSERETKAELSEYMKYDEDEGIAGCSVEDEKPIVGWHTDSYPFVCVVMLSDCTGMIGGETALRTGDGSIMKVRGPQKGCAVIMQGKYICHQALRALGARERITMVTSFRPKSPFLADDSALTTVRGISDLRELYYEWATYRLEMVEERIRTQLREMRAAYTAGRKTDTRAIKAFIAAQMAALAHTDNEMIPDELVVAGHQPHVDIPDVEVAPNAA